MSTTLCLHLEPYDRFAIEILVPSEVWCQIHYIPMVVLSIWVSGSKAVENELLFIKTTVR